MAVKVKVPTIMRKFVKDQPVVEASGGTLRDVIDDLDRSYPGLKGSIVDEGGALRRFVNLYLNDEDVRFLGSLETEVREGDTVSILPAVAGG
jgi:sulfur-carrier protein